MDETLTLFDAARPAGSGLRLVTDGVMGGISRATLAIETVDGRACARLRGEVSLANNGGFVQMSLELAAGGGRPLDASRFAGVALVARGNGEHYNLHLRSNDLGAPWQSYRQRFDTSAEWLERRLPFAGFLAHRTDRPLALDRLRRLGVVAIGRAFTADVAVARLWLYR